MQSKGAIRFVAILLAIACLWQLSFTAVTKYQENKAVQYAEAAVEAAQNSAAFAKVAEENKAFYLDSLRKVENRHYIDSISAEKVYFGYTFKDVKAKVEELLDTFKFRDAQKEAMNLARIGNKYLADTEPWKVVKTDAERVKTILNIALQITANVAIAIEPFMPPTAEKMQELLKICRGFGLTAHLGG